MKIPFTNYRINIINAKKLTVIHPDVKQLMEYSFTLEDKEGLEHEYYQFKDMNNMTAKRWEKLMEIKEAVNNRMTLEERKVTTELLEDCLNHNPILITGIARVVEILKYCDSLIMETDILHDLFTCYFIDMTMNEDVTDYNFDFNQQKKEIFKSQPPDSFFFEKPISELLPLTNISEEDLLVCSLQTKTKKDLITMAVKEIRRSLNISKESTPLEDPVR